MSNDMAGNELTDEQKKYYLDEARRRYADGSDDNIEIDDPTGFSVGEDSVWVKAWVRVPVLKLDDKIYYEDLPDELKVMADPETPRRKEGENGEENALTRDDLQFLGESIITIKDTNRCLGDLIHFEWNRSSICPNNGRVPVTKEEADIHNKVLDQAKIEGLDKNCEVGQGGGFYWDGKNVKTFLGTQVNEGHVVVSGNVRKTVYFNRKGKKFKGVLRKNEEWFWVVRTK